MKFIKNSSIYVFIIMQTITIPLHAYFHTVRNKTHFPADVEIKYLDPAGLGFCGNDRFRLEPDEQKTIGAGACTLTSVQAKVFNNLPLRIQSTAPFPVKVVVEYQSGCQAIREDFNRPGAVIVIPTQCALKSVTATGVVDIRIPDQNLVIQQAKFKAIGTFEAHEKMTGDLLVIDWKGQKKADELADQVAKFEEMQRRNPKANDPRKAPAKPAGRPLVPSIMQEMGFVNRDDIKTQTQAQGFSKNYTGNGTWLIETNPDNPKAFVINVKTTGLESGLETAYDKVVDGIDSSIKWIGNAWEVKRKIGKKLIEGATELENAPKKFEDGIIPLKAMPAQLDGPEKELKAAILKIHSAMQEAVTQEALIKSLNLSSIGFAELNTNLTNALTKLQSGLLKLTDNVQSAPNKCSTGVLCNLASTFGSSKKTIQQQITVIEEQIKTLRTKLSEKNALGQNIIDRMRRAGKVLEV